jgi:hypothetical protein
MKCIILQHAPHIKRVGGCAAIAAALHMVIGYSKWMKMMVEIG